MSGSFLSELKRRNVIRMAGLYLVASWLIVQVTGTVGPMVGAPEWVGRTVLMLLAIGFLPVMVFSWVYEITPEGLKRESEVERHASITAETATRLDRAIGWARKYSIFPYPFATACCAMEYMSLSMSPYDIDRFGALLPRFTPRQADLIMVIGTVTVRQAPILKRVYEQMGEPKWVMAFGACASSGGFYDNYTTMPGIDLVIPVDVYVPGCPPRPEAVLDGLMALQRKIQSEKQTPGPGQASAG